MPAGEGKCNHRSFEGLRDDLRIIESKSVETFGRLAFYYSFDFL